MEIKSVSILEDKEVDMYQVEIDLPIGYHGTKKLYIVMVPEGNRDELLNISDENILSLYEKGDKLTADKLMSDWAQFSEHFIEEDSIMFWRFIYELEKYLNTNYKGCNYAQDSIENENIWMRDYVYNCCLDANEFEPFDEYIIGHICTMIQNRYDSLKTLPRMVTLNL